MLKEVEHENSFITLATVFSLDVVDQSGKSHTIRESNQASGVGKAHNA